MSCKSSACPGNKSAAQCMGVQHRLCFFPSNSQCHSSMQTRIHGRTRTKSVPQCLGEPRLLHHREESGWLGCPPFHPRHCPCLVRTLETRYIQTGKQQGVSRSTDTVCVILTDVDKQSTHCWKIDSAPRRVLQYPDCLCVCYRAHAEPCSRRDQRKGSLATLRYSLRAPLGASRAQSRQADQVLIIYLAFSMYTLRV
jgi:hypothetical protein